MEEWLYVLLGSLVSLLSVCLPVCLLTDQRLVAAIPLLSMQVHLPLCWVVLKPRPQVLAPPTSALYIAPTTTTTAPVGCRDQMPLNLCTSSH